MDPVTAITTILSLIPDLLVTNGGRLIAGTYVGGRYYSTTALLKSGYVYSGGLVYAAGRRKNPWIRFLKEFRKYVSKTYNLPNRRKIAKEIYNELKKSGQLDMLIKHHRLPPEIREKLDELLVIKPRTGLELALSKKSMEFPIFPHIGETITAAPTMEFPQPSAPSMEFPHLGLPEAPIEPRSPMTSMEFPRLGLPEVTVPPRPPFGYREPTEQEVQRVAAQENIAEAVQKTLEEIPPGLPEERKQDIVAQNIQEVQKQLVSEGNFEATKPEVVLKAAADAPIGTSGEKKETVSKAVSEVTGATPQEVKQEIKEAEQTIRSITNVPTEGELEAEERLLRQQMQEAEEEKKKNRN